MTESNLKPRVQEDMKTAMKAGDSKRLGAIRLLLAAIKQREVDERITLDDTQVLAVIDKMIKQRQESVKLYQQAARQDLADQENFEIAVLQAYLPTQLTETEIMALIEQTIAEMAATSIKDMGRVMAQLKPQMQGRADMAIVSQKIKDKLPPA